MTLILIYKFCDIEYVYYRRVYMLSIPELISMLEGGDTYLGPVNPRFLVFLISTQCKQIPLLMKRPKSLSNVMEMASPRFALIIQEHSWKSE